MFDLLTERFKPYYRVFTVCFLIFLVVLSINLMHRGYQSEVVDRTVSKQFDAIYSHNSDYNWSYSVISPDSRDLFILNRGNAPVPLQKDPFTGFVLQVFNKNESVVDITVQFIYRNRATNVNKTLFEDNISPSESAPVTLYYTDEEFPDTPQEDIIIHVEGTKLGSAFIDIEFYYFGRQVPEKELQQTLDLVLLIVGGPTLLISSGIFLFLSYHFLLISKNYEKIINEIIEKRDLEKLEEINKQMEKDEEPTT